MATGSETVPTPAELASVAHWRAAESHVYPLIMSDPDLYEMVVRLIVEARDILRVECATVADLVNSQAAPVLARCALEPAVAAEGFITSSAFDAARAQRFRELEG